MGQDANGLGSRCCLHDYYGNFVDYEQHALYVMKFLCLVISFEISEM